jgi:hypothetical protein
MPSNDEFDNMRALLMNSITNANDDYEDDESGTYETESDGSDDLDDLRTSLAGVCGEAFYSLINCLVCLLRFVSEAPLFLLCPAFTDFIFC